MRVVRTTNDGTFDAARPHHAEGPELPGHDETPADGLHPLVLVTWHDAFFDFDQVGPEDCRNDYLVRTVGFLINEGPRFLSIAQEVLPDGEGFRAVTHIPITIVESVVALEPGPSTLAAGEAG